MLGFEWAVCREVREGGGGDSVILLSFIWLPLSKQRSLDEKPDGLVGAPPVFALSLIFFIDGNNDRSQERGIELLDILKSPNG